ncbi:hypothetical protein D3C75_1316350 [compost metagenome]
MLDVGTQALVIAMLTGGSFEVLQCQLHTVATAFGGKVVVIGNPDAAAGYRRRTAELVAFLDNQYR